MISAISEIAGFVRALRRPACASVGFHPFSRLGAIVRIPFGFALGLMKTLGRGPEAVPEAPAFEKPSSDMPYCVRRIRLAFELSGVRRLKSRKPGIWSVGAESFADAYRFMLLICDIGRIGRVKGAGCVRYAVSLQGGEGRIVLSESAGNGGNTLAVMTFDIEKLPDVKELRFRCAAKSPRRGDFESGGLPADGPPRRPLRRPVVRAV